MPNRLLLLILLALPLPALAETAPASSPGAEEKAAPETPTERAARKARKARKTMRAIEDVAEPVADGGAPMGRSSIDALIAMHAKAHKVPERLIHYVVKRESNYNPRAVGRGGVYGLMQLKHGTARGVGYEGPASGLLDAKTNLAYGIAYLAGAYRTANGDEAQAYRYFARGYYYAAKRQGVRTQVAAVEPPIAPTAGGGVGGLIDKVFGRRQAPAVVTASADPDSPVLPAATSVAAAPATPALRGTVSEPGPAEAAAPAPPSAATAPVQTAAITVIDEASFKSLKTEAEVQAVLAALSTLPLPPRRPASLRLAARKGGTSAVPKTARAPEAAVGATASQ